MPNEKSAVSLPSLPKSVTETDPADVKSLDSLQDQAKVNTRFLTQDVRSLAERDKELLEMEARLAAMDENPESEADLLEQRRVQERVGTLRREQEDTQKRINQRRARSGAIIRRRVALQKEHGVLEQRRIEQERDETAKKLKLGDLVTRKETLLGELARLAESAQQAQFRATSPEQRDLARRLMALQRSCFAALEALKRAPELIVDVGE